MTLPGEVRVIEGINIKISNKLKETQNHFELTASYQGFELPGVKLQ